ncbi:hypothetical protein HHK36_012557 [Tetracentron sinense]|uniref:Uncharacterized protein n=1 Tax=Tetracentron sinense TaxID=13715 RepID=A0A835DFT0_TETSI|nr:hypothetical protein HHK36_012557 [Tetracentron sinense]
MGDKPKPPEERIHSGDEIYRSSNVPRSVLLSLKQPLRASSCPWWVGIIFTFAFSFHPSSDLFVPNEKKNVITSTACLTTMAALLVGLSFIMGLIQMLKLYRIPYWVFVMWLDLVTYLHHHGHEQKLPWYRGKVSGLELPKREGLRRLIGTTDGLITSIVILTEAAKPVLGKFYRGPKIFGPLT